MLRLLAGLITLLGTRGIRAVLAENFLLKRQLLVLRRSRRRAPNLRTADRLLFGLFSQFLSPRRLMRAALILKPATLLRLHRGFKDFKYRFLYSSRPKKKPGPQGPSPELVRAICELKRRNPRFGCPKIAQQPVPQHASARSKGCGGPFVAAYAMHFPFYVRGLQKQWNHLFLLQDQGIPENVGAMESTACNPTDPSAVHADAGTQ